MEELKRIGYFIKVVETNSFSKAARILSKTKSVVSRQISLLEEEVGARLLNRTTRNISLTESGEIYYKYCKDIVSQSTFVLEKIRQKHNQPTGNLRIACPVMFGCHFIIPALYEFRKLYPHLNIDLLMDDTNSNMVNEGIDISIKGGWLKDSSLIAKKFYTSETWLVAAPSYLSTTNNIPHNPEDLLQHPLINLDLLPSPLRWTFTKDNHTQTVQFPYKVKTNSVAAARQLALVGEGATALAKYTVENDVCEGRLIRLLPGFELQSVSFYAVYLQRKHLPPKIRLFLNHLFTYFSEPL